MRLHPIVVVLTIMVLTALFAVALWPLLRTAATSLRTARARHTFIHTTIREWVSNHGCIMRTSSHNVRNMVPRKNEWTEDMEPITAYGWASWMVTCKLDTGYTLNLNGDIAQHWSPSTPVLIIYNENTCTWHFGLFGNAHEDISYRFSALAPARFAGVFAAGVLDDHALAG